MAYSPALAKQHYQNASVPELEEAYNQLKTHFCFKSKEEQIRYIIDNYLSASLGANTNSDKIALEELLLEKTGKTYHIEPQTFDITLADIIDTLSNGDQASRTSLTSFLQKLTTITDDQKIRFLIELAQLPDAIPRLSAEASTTTDPVALFNQYDKLAGEYCSAHRAIG